MNHVDLRDFLSAYLAEVDEQLHAANGRLLEVDAHLREGKPHPRAVRDLFRALHTIKGLSAMVNVEPAVTIAHRLEALVRAADRNGGRLAGPAVDAILEGVHAIELRARELSEGKPVSAAPAALLEALDRLEPVDPRLAASEGGDLDLDPALASKLAPFERDALLAPEGGRRALRVDFSPSPAKAAAGLSINSVRERVGKIAEIVKVLPVAVPPSDDAPGGLRFALLVVSNASDAALAEAASVDPAAVVTLVAAKPTAAPLPPLEAAEETDEEVPAHQRGVIRVDVVRLDEAMEHLASLVVTRSRLGRAVGALSARGYDTRELTEILRDSGRQLRDLRASILRVRMVPVSEVLERIPLLLRGLRRDSGKNVRLEIDAGNAELDKAVAERLFPAIVHLVRNAVDHAIEPPEERRRLGKAEEGILRITCRSPSNTRLDLSVADDGAGIDRALVARRLGREIAEEALLDTLCSPGFSTRERATTTSGRGMGMDIVRRAVEKLGGELALSTEPGVGTTFTLRVPLTISIIDAFTVDCRRRRFVVPVSMIDEIVEVDPARVRSGPRRAGGDEVFLLESRGEALPLLELATALGMEEEERRSALAVVVRRGGQPVAFGLDRVVGQQEAVVRPLVDPLVQVAGLSGATDLGDGKPTLVLDLVALSAGYLSRSASPPQMIGHA